MDIPVITGVILCPLCRTPRVVNRSYAAQPLRTIQCTNIRCKNYQLPQEVSLYTAPRAQGPSALGLGLAASSLILDDPGTTL